MAGHDDPPGGRAFLPRAPVGRQGRPVDLQRAPGRFHRPRIRRHRLRIRRPGAPGGSHGRPIDSSSSSIESSTSFWKPHGRRKRPHGRPVSSSWTSWTTAQPAYSILHERHENLIDVVVGERDVDEIGLSGEETPPRAPMNLPGARGRPPGAPGEITRGPLIVTGARYHSSSPSMRRVSSSINFYSRSVGSSRSSMKPTSSSYEFSSMPLPPARCPAPAARISTFFRADSWSCEIV